MMPLAWTPIKDEPMRDDGGFGPGIPPPSAHSQAVGRLFAGLCGGRLALNVRRLNVMPELRPAPPHGSAPLTLTASCKSSAPPATARGDSGQQSEPGRRAAWTLELARQQLDTCAVIGDLRGAVQAAL